MVHATFANRGSSSLYFSTANIHSNKTVNKKKSRKCEKQGIKKFVILVLYPSKNVTVLPTKIHMRWMTMNELSIIDGVIRPEEINLVLFDHKHTLK